MLLQTLEGTITLLRQKTHIIQISSILNPSFCSIPIQVQDVQYERFKNVHFYNVLNSIKKGKRRTSEIKNTIAKCKSSKRKTETKQKESCER